MSLSGEIFFDPKTGLENLTIWSSINNKELHASITIYNDQKNTTSLLVHIFYNDGSYIFPVYPGNSRACSCQNITQIIVAPESEITNNCSGKFIMEIF
ncbi:MULTISPECIES: S-Ena type endospore appendage [unclassified Paenibacillus]|uniref:S-Ena type endospore appendage n=1 Tax=unclassified Paenibacillus TaxID=185978 RepID=UPI003FA7B4B6